MTSKTFKSAMTDNRELEVDVIFSKPRLLIKEFDGDNTGFVFAPSDAPVLMQAIGECLPPIPATVRDGSYEAFMAVALEYLGNAIRALDAEATEAEAQAKLEAEALELLNAHREATGNPLAESLDGLLYNAKETWLAVARRAREINKEEGQ